MSFFIGIFFVIVFIGWLAALPITRGEKVDTSFYFIMGCCWLVITACCYIGLLIGFLVIWSVINGEKGFPWHPPTMLIIAAIVAYKIGFGKIITLMASQAPIPAISPELQKQMALEEQSREPGETVNGKRRLPPGLARYYENLEKQKHCA